MAQAQLSREPRRTDVVERLAALISEVASSGSELQRSRLAGLAVTSLTDLDKIAPIGKQDLVADQRAHPPFGTNLAYPPERYVHLHQTSGTSGETLRILDTEEDWNWWRGCMGTVFEAAGIGPGDLVALAYSFGPYIQFWASYEGAGAVGANRIALGGMDSVQRLETIRAYSATAVICTPSYAIRLAKVAAANDMTDALQTVQRILCTGEPGASLPAVRTQIEELWDASCLDHAGLSEVGAFGYPCAAGGGFHINEREFVAEVLEPGAGKAVASGELGELVLTALGRTGFPVIRYRTGDVVELHSGVCPAGHADQWIPGGILGRTDDMVVIRGMNVFPSAIEQVLRETGGVGEFRITFYAEPAAMDEVKVEVELAQPARAREIHARLRQRLGLRIRIVPLKPGILPARSGKARRVVDARPVRTRRIDREAGEPGGRGAS